MAEAIAEFDEPEENATCDNNGLFLNVFDQNTFYRDLQELGFRLGKLNPLEPVGQEVMNYIKWKVTEMDTVIHKYLGALKYLYRHGIDSFEFNCTIIINVMRSARDGTHYIAFDRYQCQIFRLPIVENEITVHISNAWNGDVTVCSLMPHWFPNIKGSTNQELEKFRKVLISCYGGTNPLNMIEEIRSEEYPPVRLVLSYSEMSNGLSMQIIADLYFLTVLDISSNGLDHIPAPFGSLLSLRELNISNNQLGTSRRTVFEQWEWLFGPKIVKSLQVLDLSNNCLTELPATIWKLRKLVRLNAQDNRLRVLPRKMTTNYSLEYVLLQNNRICYLPENLL